MAFTDVIARLAVSLNLDTAAFQTGTRRVRRDADGMRSHLTKVGGAIAGAFAGISLGAAVQQFRDMTKVAIDSAGALGETAQQLGVGTRALQEYRFAATQVGLSTAEMDGALGQLTRRLGDAQLGAKGPADALEKLGISLASLKGQDVGDVIPRIAEGLAQLSDPTERASIAVDLFGKSGQKLMPLLSEGAAGVDKFRAEAERLGLVLSEGDIAKADETADKLAALNYQIEAQSNKKLLENAEAVLAYEAAIGDMKLALIEAVGGLQTFGEWFETHRAKNGQLIRDLDAGFEQLEQGLYGFGVGMKGFLDTVASTTRAVPVHVARMVSEVAAAVTGRLNAVWEDAKAKVRSVRDAFFDLWDKVTRRSYVPDMVDDIAREMARLDGVMVQPAKKAADDTKQAMREMASETRALLDRLFPEVGKALGYARDLKLLEGSALNDNDKAVGRGRLGREVTGTAGEVPISVLGADPLVDADRMEAAALRTIDAFVGLRDRAGVTTVAVAKSFKDMADATLQSLNSLAGAIRGGGFLDILSAVVGLGLQLGGIGAFGKTIADRINAPSTVPKRALGGPVRAGMPYLVGERRPELVVPRHSGTVVPNGKFEGGKVEKHYHFTGNLLTPEFWDEIRAGDERAARTGAGLAQLQFANSRRWSLG